MKTYVRFLLTASLVLATAFTISCGPSAAQQAMLALPSVEEVKDFEDKLAWLKTNAKSGESYVIEVTRNEKINDLFSSPGDFSYKGKKDITIIIKGVGGNRSISTGEAAKGLFIVGSGVTLVLDENITANGIKAAIGGRGF